MGLGSCQGSEALLLPGLCPQPLAILATKCPRGCWAPPSAGRRSPLTAALCASATSKGGCRQLGLRTPSYPRKEQEETLCKANSHSGTNNGQQSGYSSGQNNSFCSFAIGFSAGLHCSSIAGGWCFPLYQGQSIPKGTLLQSTQVLQDTKSQPGSPQKLNTSKLPYSERLFLLFPCKDQNVFVGNFGLLNLAITNQYSSSQRILEGKHWKRLWRLPTTQQRVLETWLWIRHSF